MTYHHAPATEKSIYSRGALPWHGFIAQCKIGVRIAENSKLARPNTQQMQRAREVHARVKEYLSKGKTNINTTAEALGLTRTTAYKHLKLLVVEGDAVSCMRNNEMHYTEKTR